MVLVKNSEKVPAAKLWITGIDYIPYRPKLSTNHFYHLICKTRTRVEWLSWYCRCLTRRRSNFRFMLMTEFADRIEGELEHYLFALLHTCVYYWPRLRKRLVWFREKVFFLPSPVCVFESGNLWKSAFLHTGLAERDWFGLLLVPAANDWNFGLENLCFSACTLDGDAVLHNVW